MTQIVSVKGREILDSRGYPTVEVDVVLVDGQKGRMQVPSGASTGKWEAHELRDGDPARYGGRGVLNAVANVNGELGQAIIGYDALDQQGVDDILIGLDGTDNKERLGANAILGVSFAVARAAANASNLPFYRYLAQSYDVDQSNLAVPLPMINVISGGLHAGGKLDLQDYLVVPIGAETYPQALEHVAGIWQATRILLDEGGYEAHLVADEGGLGPALQNNEQALGILCQAMERTGLRPGHDMAIALDVAATHFYDSETETYGLSAEQSRLSSEEMVERLTGWVDSYPIVSIEDGLSEDDWDGWQLLTKRLGGRIQILGDDLFTTNPTRIERGIQLEAANAVLIKNNQIGTLSETVLALRTTHAAGFRTVVSARSGETEDNVLADLAVGLNGGQIKVGSLTRSSRLSKYNQLLRIGEDLGGAYIGGGVLTGR